MQPYSAVSPCRQPGIVYGFRIRDTTTGRTRIDYVGKTFQDLRTREMQHRGVLAKYGRAFAQPWSDLIAGHAIIIELGKWTSAELTEREIAHIHHLQPRYNETHNLLNPDRITKRDAIRLRDERDRRLGRWRLSDDIATVEEMARSGFSGPMYRRWSDDSARYAVGHLTRWAVEGRIIDNIVAAGFGKCDRLGTSLAADDAAEIAYETVAKALQHFRDDVLVSGRWDPEQGAALRTFFMGQCLMRYGNVYRAWRNGEARNRAILVPDLDLLDRPVDGPGPDDLVVMRSETNVFLSAAQPRTREVVCLLADGWTQSEVAARLGMTTNAVEKCLHYYRRHVLSKRSLISGCAYNVPSAEHPYRADLTETEPHVVVEQQTRAGLPMTW